MKFMGSRERVWGAVDVNVDGYLGRRASPLSVSRLLNP